MSLITGKILTNTRLVRLTNEHENHYDFQYQDGWNEDHLDFNPSNSCQAGGLYFCLPGLIRRFKNINGNTHFVRIVTIDPDEPVWDEGNGKFKAKRIHLGPKNPISDFKITRDDYLTAVTQNGRALYYVPEELKDHDMCVAAVTQYGYTLGYVPRELMDSEMCLAAVTQDGGSLEYVPMELRDRKVCLAAVTQYGCALQHVPDELRDREVCLASVTQYGWVLQHVPVELRDREVCLAAVTQKGNALVYVPNDLRDRDMCLAAGDSEMVGH